jgi:hypothetical protein
VQYKLYAAQQALECLKQLEKQGSFSSSNIHRVRWEMKIESMLAHLVGSVDALLVRINEKLRLGLDIKCVNSSPRGMKVINDKLNVQGKGKLLEDLNDAVNDAVKEKCWFWTLKDIRNQGLHRSLINKHVRVGGTRTIVSLKTDPQTDLEIIPYLEDSINRTKKLINNIIQNEPLLKMMMLGR